VLRRLYLGAGVAYLLLTDETNQQPSERARFFIYGGVFFPAAALPDLHDLVEEARDEAGYERADEFKFDTRSRPGHVTRQAHTTAKRTVLEGCSDTNVRFIAYLVLHDIARNRSLEQLVRFGVNTVLSTFQKFLTREDETGICLVDRLPYRHGHQSLGEIFQHGLQMPNNRYRVLDRVLLLGETTQQESFLGSIVDIVLGSFRYCVNERENERATRAMLPPVVQMMWSRRSGDTVHVREYGLLFRPLNVAVPAYQDEYEELTLHFQNLLEGA
jgi:hypothetical protein